MIDMISSLVRYIVILIFLSTLLEMILPQGVFRSYLRVIVGIMLIFTIISPLQNITEIAPYWETPAWVGETGQEQLENILQQGETIQKSNIELALDEYHQSLQEVIRKKIKNEYNLEVVEVEAEIEQNPDSISFGVIDDIKVWLSFPGLSCPGQNSQPEKVSRVIIGQDEEINGAKGGVNKEEYRLFEEIEQEVVSSLSAFLGLPCDRISVKLLGNGESND